MSLNHRLRRLERAFRPGSRPCAVCRGTFAVTGGILFIDEDGVDRTERCQVCGRAVHDGIAYNCGDQPEIYGFDPNKPLPDSDL